MQSLEFELHNGKGSARDRDGSPSYLVLRKFPEAGAADCIYSSDVDDDRGHVLISGLRLNDNILGARFRVYGLVQSRIDLPPVRRGMWMCHLACEMLRESLPGSHLLV